MVHPNFSGVTEVKYPFSPYIAVTYIKLKGIGDELILDEIISGVNQKKVTEVPGGSWECSKM